MFYAGQRYVRRLVFSWVAVVMLAGLPSTARADCLNEAIESCNADFSAASEKLLGARGWCYMIRWAWCEAFDPKDT